MRHSADQRGSVSALIHAPYGYRSVGTAQGADLPHDEVVLDEARVVRQIFDWVGRERLTLGEVARRLSAQGLLTRTGNRRPEPRDGPSDAAESHLPRRGSVRPYP
jgi:site-specific DNA recombinase